MKKRKFTKTLIALFMVLAMVLSTVTVSAFPGDDKYRDFSKDYDLLENVGADIMTGEENFQSITPLRANLPEIEILNVEVLWGGQYSTRWRIGDNHPNYDFNFTRHSVYGYADSALFGGRGHQPGRWYTTARNVNMQEPRLFTLQFTVPGSFTGVGVNPGEFNVNNLDWSYGGRALSAWTASLNAATIAWCPGARVRIEGTPTAVLNGDGSVTVTAGLRFGTFVNNLVPTGGTNRPGCAWSNSNMFNRPWGAELPYFPVTNPGLAFVNQVGYHAFVAYYNGNAVAETDIRFSVNDIFKRWAELEEFIVNHPANVLNAPQGLDNHGPYDRFLKIEPIGQGVAYVNPETRERRNIWSAVIADSRATVDRYLNVTQPLLTSNPAQLQADLLAGPGPNQHRGVLFFSGPHGGELPAPGLVYELVYRLIYEYELVFTRAAEYNRLIPRQANYATGNSAFRHRVGDDYIEQRVSVDELLERYIIVMLFHANPDGFSLSQRGTHYNFDLNRDGSSGQTPEGRALQRAVARWMPIAFLDIHGYYRNFLIDGTTMPWVPFFEPDLIDAHSVSMIDAMGMSIIGRSAMALYNIPTRDAASGWMGVSWMYNPSMAKLFGSIGFTIELPDNHQDSFDAMMQGFYGFFKYVTDDDTWFSVMYNIAEFQRRNILNLDLRDVVDPHLMRVHPYFYEMAPYVTFEMPYQRQIGRPRTPNPAGGYFDLFPEYHVIPVCRTVQMSPGAAFDALYLLANVGVIIERTTQEVTYNGVTYPVGTHIISMRQARRAFAHAVLSDGFCVEGHIMAGTGGDTIISFPRMRGFETFYTRTQGAFDAVATEQVPLSEVALTVSRVNITGEGDLVVVRNDSPDAIRMVNRIVAAGNDVYIITGGVPGASLGDFVAQRSHVIAAAEAAYNRVFGYIGLTLNGFGLGAATEMPELAVQVQVPHVGHWYSSVAWSSATRYILELYEFPRHTALANVNTPVAAADVYFITHGGQIGGALAAKIRDEGVPLIAVGLTAQLANIVTNPADRITCVLSPGEVLMRVDVTENIVLSNLCDLEAVYLQPALARLFTSVPSWITPLITVQDSDDFLIQGRLIPGRLAASGPLSGFRGTTVVGTGIYTTNAGVDIPITVMTPNMVYRHSQDLYFRIIANAILTKASGIDVTAVPPPVPSFNIFNNGQGGTVSTPNESLAAAGIIRMWTQLDGIGAPFAYEATATITAYDQNDNCAMEFIRVGRRWQDGTGWLDDFNLIDVNKNGQWQYINFTINVYGQTVRVLLVNDLFAPPPVPSFNIFNNGEGGTVSTPNASLAAAGIIRMWTQLDGSGAPFAYATAATITAYDQDDNCAMEFVRVNRRWVDGAGWQDDFASIDVNKNGQWQYINFTITVYGQIVEVLLVNDLFAPLPVPSFDIFNNGLGGTVSRPNASLAAAGIIRMWTQLDGVGAPFDYADAATMTAYDQDDNCAMDFVRVNRRWVAGTGWSDDFASVDVDRNGPWQSINFSITVYGQTVEILLVND